MEFKADVMDADALRRCLIRMSHQILERNGGTDNLCLVGIKRRGIPIAGMIRDNILNIEGADVPVGTLDITLYRDDLSELGSFPKISESDLPFDVTGKTIVLKERTDPSLIGGIVLKYGDRSFDGSVKARLDAMKKEIGSVIS